MKARHFFTLKEHWQYNRRFLLIGKQAQHG